MSRGRWIAVVILLLLTAASLSCRTKRSFDVVDTEGRPVIAYLAYRYQGSVMNFVHPATYDASAMALVRTDRDGRLYVATRLGLQVCDQAGRVNCIIPTPNGKVSNLTFGGAKFDTIFATCGDRVYSRKVKVTGANGWQAPQKPAAPRL